MLEQSLRLGDREVLLRGTRERRLQAEEAAFSDGESAAVTVLRDWQILLSVVAP